MAFNQEEQNNENRQHQRRLYNPYQDLEIPVQKLYQLPTQPEYLFHEEAVHQRRSWGENLTYYTGCGYLLGASSGASKGLIDAVRASEHGDTIKLRVNRVLNSSGLTGRQWGNRAGVIGLMYAALESGIVKLRDTDDVGNSVAAGLATGVIYKAGSGPRAAALAGAVGGLLVGCTVGMKHALKRYVPV
ncbi:Mitochondrial import inner membrane translocase subunit TIM23-2 [Bienertia sinuspersici]